MGAAACPPVPGVVLTGDPTTVSNLLPTCTATVAVATSGGRDSTALLHATVQAAAGLGLQVVALHVHHGLQPEADAWLAQVRGQCARWARAGKPVSFLFRRLEGQPAAGQSVEAWARAGRYRALAEMAREAGASCVLLAHHRRDQAETVLLQALRGAGPAGLAAMPRAATRQGVTWLRPWLDQPAAAIDHYIAHWRLSHVEDPSNRDRRYARNRLRHGVWPALLAAFPEAEQVLVHAAGQAALAAQLQAEIAREDLARLTSPARSPLPTPQPQPAGVETGPRPAPLLQTAWLGLSPARRAGVLRLWLSSQLDAGVPDLLVARLCAEWPGRAAGRWPAGPGLELRAYRGELRLERPRGGPGEPASRPPAGHQATPAAPPPATVDGPHDFSRPGLYPLPAWRGTLAVSEVAQGGVSPACLQAVLLKPRSGGEQFQWGARSTARSLKKQFQARAVPAWEREGPLVWQGDALLFVPGLGVDARQLAPQGTPQRALHWWPDDPPAAR